MFALVDCNNFYCSCERIFQPALNKRPVIVLSNNDGCAIARSEEAKGLGIKMGTPAHFITDLVKEHNVAMFSSNYTLYGDMSQRVMSVLKSFVPVVEVYSIDESFLDMSNMKYDDLQQLGERIKKTVKQHTGIPVSVGIGPTKTLAKMANRFAKKCKREIGVHWLANDELRKEVLSFTEIGDVWGIGHQYAKFLQQHGVNTAADFMAMPEEWVRSNMTVVGQRMFNELKGIPAIEWELEPPKKKGICSSRSFGALVKDKWLLEEAAANYASICAQKLREQQSCAGTVHVFVMTNEHRKQDAQYHAGVTLQLDVATNDTGELIKHVIAGVDLLFKDGYNYQKVGVEVGKIVQQNEVQQSLFDSKNRNKSNILMNAMDVINKVFGRDMVKMCRQGYEKTWRLRTAHLSNRYTTRIEEICVVKN